MAAARLAYDGKLLGSVTRIAIDSVLGFYKRRMRDTEDDRCASPPWKCGTLRSIDLRFPDRFDRRSDGIRSRFRKHSIGIPAIRSGVPSHSITVSGDSISVPEHSINAG